MSSATDDPRPGLPSKHLMTNAGLTLGSFSHHGETRDVYREVVQKLNAYFRVEAGSLLLRDHATGELAFAMTLEGGKEKLVGAR